jgi:hypothetical protein
MPRGKEPTVPRADMTEKEVTEYLREEIERICDKDND